MVEVEVIEAATGVKGGNAVAPPAAGVTWTLPADVEGTVVGEVEVQIVELMGVLGVHSEDLAAAAAAGVKMCSSQYLIH